MKKRLLLVFLILIFMPVTVITVMAVNTYRNSAAQAVEKQKEEAFELLTVNDRLLQDRIRQIEMELDQLVLDSSIDRNDLRSSMNRERLVRQAFIIDDLNNFLYPFGEEETSLRERDFLNEAEKIDLPGSLKARILPVENRNSESLWYTWFMGDGINFIYYRKTESHIQGFLIERYAFISQLINVLPQTDRNNNLYRIRLTDARGEILYQWGNYSPEENEQALREYSLSEPLGSWRLFYYNNDEHKKREPADLSAFYILPGLGLLTLVIFLLALYFYRENSREMETARKQVTFVNQISHELKTPLTNIRLYSELLQNKLKESKERSYLDVIVNESNRLGRMINNVLTFSRGERGELKKRTENIDMNILIGEILEKFNPLLSEKSMTVDYQGISTPLIESDRDMIEQILGNLIGNAVKYGSSGEYLGINSHIADGKLVIYIIDKGPGIPEAEAEKIFRPFYRIDNSLAQNTAGTGIGLSIARTLAEETGCRLNLEKSVGGACFSLSIPLSGEQI